MGGCQNVALGGSFEIVHKRFFFLEALYVPNGAHGIIENSFFAQLEDNKQTSMEN